MKQYLRMCSAMLLLAFIIIALPGCESRQTSDDSSSITPASDIPASTDALLDPGIPFSNMKWGASQESVLEIIGKKPSTEYDDNGTHYIVIDDLDYLGYNGRFIFQLDNSGLYLKRFIYEGFTSSDVEYFIDKYTDLYGKGDEPYEDCYSWDTASAHIFVSVGALDSIIIEFTDLS